MASTNQVDLYTITEFIEAYKDTPPAPQFLKNSLFGTVETGWGQQVAVDYSRGSSRVAPYCTPYKRAIAIPRLRFKTQWLEFPDIKISRDVRALDLRYRLSGESIVSNVGSAERLAILQAEDYQTLDLEISRREEKSCADVLFTGKILIVDGDDGKPLQEVDFSPINEVVIDPLKFWDTATGDPLSDLTLLKRNVTSSGYPANFYVMGVDAANAFLGSAKVTGGSNFLNYRQGVIDPQAFKDYENFGVNVLGTFWGLNLLSYEGMYEDPNDEKMHYFMPPDMVLIASTASQNRYCFGQITQVEESAGVKSVMDYQLPRVPQYVAEGDEDQIKFRLWSRGLPIPNNVLTWAVAKVCTLKSNPIPAIKS